MSQDLIIRADGGDRMGMGHVMRCIALGQQWRDDGGRVLFVTASENISILEKNRFHVERLKASYPDAADLEGVESVRMKCEPVAVVVDGYHFDAAYQERLRTAGNKVLVIDDNAHLSHYCADFILNPNAYAGSLDYSCDPHTRLLLGARYALLRREFSAAAREPRPAPVKAKRVLVTMGGSDPNNCTIQVLEALRMIDSSLEIVVVVGQSNPHRAAVEAAAVLDQRVRLEIDSERMQSLMMWADLAISGAGQTCLELAYMGVPMCICVIADNQIRAGHFFENAGVAVRIGDDGFVNGEAARSAITHLLADRPRRAEMSRRGMELVDGQGCRAALRELTLTKQ